MLKDITIGQYYPANSKIHKLDPRTKIIAAIIFMIALFVINQFWPYVIILGLLTNLCDLVKARITIDSKIFVLP